jgi:hypothetical protein
MPRYQARPIHESELDELVDLLYLVHQHPQGHERYRSYIDGDPILVCATDTGHRRRWPSRVDAAYLGPVPTNNSVLVGGQGLASFPLRPAPD